jgi:Ca2+-binding RTX toxin-like protein
VGATGVYKVDLSQFGSAPIRQITIADDNFISGGTGGASGFDLDFIKVSTVNTNSASTAASLPNIAGFDFTSNGTFFEPGFLQTWRPGYQPSWNTSTLFGTFGSQSLNNGLANLAVRDGTNASNVGAISLGEGGSITFILDTPILPNSGATPFLYIGDAGGGNDDSFVFVDDSPTFTPRPGLTLNGTSSDDTIALGQGRNFFLGDGDDVISGERGNDRIWTAGGDDIIAPGPGNDQVVGGSGIDTVDFESSIDGARIQIFTNALRTFTRDGTDELFEVEFLLFDEGRIDLSDTGANDLAFATGSSQGRFLLGGETYTGPVDFLERELIMTSQNEIVNGTARNDFINSRGGTDAIDAGAGNDVVDGGTGSNFLTGGSGVDTFFTDARIPGLITWSTITDFDPANEQATIWGWRPGVSSGVWVASDGAEGFKGATFHADVNGNGQIDTSITFTGLSRSDIMQPLEFDDLLWFV